MYIEGTPQAYAGTTESASTPGKSVITLAKETGTAPEKAAEKLSQILSKLDHSVNLQPVDWIKVTDLTEKAQEACRQKYIAGKCSENFQ